MQIKEYFNQIQEWIKENIEDKSQIDNIIKYLNRDNIQSVVNQDFHNSVSVEECAEKLLDNYEEQGEIQDVAPNTIGGDRGNNKMEKRIMKYTEFINEKSKNLS